MNPRHRAGATLALLALVLASAGCGNHRSMLAPTLGAASDPPAISVNAFRLGASRQSGLARYRVSWRVTSGSADHFVYTLDPRAARVPDARWTSTRATSFDLSTPVRSDALTPARDGRLPAATTFLVRAVDGTGRLSPLGGISVINDNIAPQVQITQPVPSDRSRSYVPSTFTIFWQGTDPDGVISNRPAQYKWTLLTPNSELPYNVALADPDSVRRRYEPTGYDGWDSMAGDLAQPSVTYTNLIPGNDYMFVVVARDEQGAWSQVFSQNTNMLNFRVVADGQGGPVITMFNAFFFYQYSVGSYQIGPQYEAPFTAPAGAAIPVNWTAQPLAGTSVQAYRWALDIADVFDNTPRIDEATDVTHWSAPSATTTAATVGPFGPGETHRLYIEARDLNGLRSLGIARIQTVAISRQRDLLIVDDTRFLLDSRSPGVPCINIPPSVVRWPTAAELDTFLYARGGVPLTCYPAGTTTNPGLFAGYDYDTIGTRGPNAEPTLATLAPYRHVIWLTDQLGATNTHGSSDVANQITALRSMTAPGRTNALAAYVAGGGDLWVAGGGIAYASLIAYNHANNDNTQPAPGVTFSYANGELVPGRFPYSTSGWQSEIKSTLTQCVINRNLGRFQTTPTLYANLPGAMRARNPIADPIPPGRSISSGSYYYTNFEVEYLSQPNPVVEGFDEHSTLDTLYSASGGGLVSPAFNPLDVCMTRYHPEGQPPVIFTGFDLWSFHRADSKDLVDFVLQQLWGMSRTAEAVPIGDPQPVPSPNPPRR